MGAVAAAAADGLYPPWRGGKAGFLLTLPWLSGESFLLMHGRGRERIRIAGPLTRSFHTTFLFTPEERGLTLWYTTVHTRSFSLKGWPLIL